MAPDRASRHCGPGLKEGAGPVGVLTPEAGVEARGVPVGEPAPSALALPLLFALQMGDGTGVRLGFGPTKLGEELVRLRIQSRRRVRFLLPCGLDRNRFYPGGLRFIAAGIRCIGSMMRQILVVNFFNSSLVSVGSHVLLQELARCRELGLGSLSHAGLNVQREMEGEAKVSFSSGDRGRLNRKLSWFAC